MKMNITLIIHNCAPKGRERVFYYGKNGKKYTEEEYCKMIRKKEAIKEIIQTVIFIIFLTFRAYVFLEHGI